MKTMTELMNEFDRLMNQRRAVYGRFWAPWNIEKANDLAYGDDKMAKIFKELQDIVTLERDKVNALEASLDNSEAKTMEVLDSLAKSKAEFQKFMEDHERMVHEYENAQQFMNAAIKGLEVDLQNAREALRNAVDDLDQEKLLNGKRRKKKAKD